MFTAEEIKEIENESGFTDMSKSLPESLVNILMELNGKVTGIYFNVSTLWN